MHRHFHEQLEALKQMLLAMGELVQEQITSAMRAFEQCDDVRARQVIDRDRQVNTYDVEIDDRCIKLIGLHQPAGGDLRFITTAMKIVTDLEQIGDQAVNVAQRVLELELNRGPEPAPSIDLSRLAECAQRMVRQSLDAFVARDVTLARQVCGKDTEVDTLKEQVFGQLLAVLVKSPGATSRAGHLILVSRALERVADHATNIAEMVVDMVEGKMVRHTPA